MMMMKDFRGKLLMQDNRENQQAAMVNHLKDEVINKRFNYAFILALMVQAAVFDGFKLFLKIISWHPLSGALGWLNKMCGPWPFFHHLVLILSLFGFSYFHKRYHSVERKIFFTRLEYICYFLSIQKIYHMILLCGLSCTNVFCYVSRLGDAQESNFFESLLHCDDAAEYIFLFFNGVFAGILFSWKYYNEDWYMLKFSIAPTPSITTLASKLPKILAESVRDVVKSIYICYIFYFLFGSYLVNFLSIFFESLSSVQISMYSIMSLKLLVASVLTSSLLHVMWRVYIELFNIVVTEKFEFPSVTTARSNKSDMVLTEALGCSDDIIQCLAFIDLRCLSQFSPEKRKIFFTISQPGGHPKNWQALSSIFIKRLSHFLERIELLVAREKIKNINDDMVYDDSVEPESILQEFVMKLPSVKYVTEELPDIRAIEVFTTCQIDIWTIEALGFFLSSAYVEDGFGAVQKSLPRLISLLIDLKLTEEKLPVTVMNFKKYAKDSSFLHKAIAQRKTLKSALDSTIYRIVLAYKTDIRGVNLSVEHHACLEKYLEFKR